MSNLRFQVKDLTTPEKGAVQTYINLGGEVHEIPYRASGLGWTDGDFARAARGLPVATPADIEAERNRRLLIAITNNNAILVQELISKKHDRAIKFDLTHERGGPRLKGNIRQVSGEHGDVIGRRNSTVNV